MTRWGLALALLCLAAPAWAQTTPASGVICRDEGTTLGRASTLDFTGSAVTASLTAGVCTVSVTGGSGGAPTDATYLTQTPHGDLSAEQALSLLTTGLMLTTTTTGVVSIYGGTACTNQFPRSLDASGAATCASVATDDLGANAVTLAKLATQANQTVLSNVSGGVAVPSANTLTATLDAILGTTQGSVIYRSATGWVALGPGTAGQPLLSGGPAADPAFADPIVSQPTAALLNATVVQGTSPWIVAGGGTAGSAASGVVTVQGIASMTKLLVTPDSVALPANQSVNVAQINGVTPLMGAGNTGTGSPRVTVATDQAALPAQGHGATGAAVPAGATQIGGRGSGAAGAPVLTAPVVCDNWSAINLTANGTIITGAASKKTYICSLNLVTATAQNIALITGTGAACVTTQTAGMAGGTTAATGWNLAANGGLTLGTGVGVVIGGFGNTGDNVCLMLSGSGQTSGTVAWAQF